ncbi:MAG: alpha/beta hydrolase [Lachnospiraceae bacterium]|nr:alpha/beta hydrolase [Lachnospiraceae bacterium]MDD6448558.1 alpha/beta hydrolase [Lachnospiraceae bacterium]MDD6450578.1 alpha/beta hydrolase [Lachnospiraceae bacterium]MDD6578875.1 alpha/beta hydrolase [Lachnospiraceae bacterium]
MDLTIDGKVIYYKVTGDPERDETVVILQGWGTKCSLYDNAAQFLSDQYRVIQFDFPGFGNSEEPEEAWDVEHYVDFFLKFMRALDIHHAVLMGHSYGGRVIIRLSARHQEEFRIDRIVLVDAAGILPVKTKKQERKIRRYKRMKKLMATRLLTEFFPDLVEDWKSRQGSADYRNASPLMKKALVMAVNEDLSDKLPLIREDTLLIWGDKDTATPLSDGQKMEREIPHAGLTVIPNTGHFSFLENQPLFFRILGSYLKGEV